MKHTNTRLNGSSCETLKNKISIQGYEGSFHQVAAQEFFGKHVEVICCNTFRDVVNIADERNECTGGLIAIENSIAGSILGNYNLIRKSNLRITGEVYLHIRQNLLVNRGVTLEDIHEVHSHPMAIQQCLKFLDQNNWKLVETEDTALSAKNIHQHKSKHVAAVGSLLAAELYDLDVIVPDIHTVKNNFTRFWVLQNKDDVKVEDDANKASIAFVTDHERGSLARVLVKIAEMEMDVSKLQSFPIPETSWQYMFGLDVEFQTLQQFYAVVEAIRLLTGDVKVYGIYKKGKTVQI